MPKLDRALRGSVVEPKQSAEPLAALDPTASSRVVDRRVDEPVANALVIPLAVVVRDVLTDRASQARFPNRNDLCQALGLDRSHESLRVGVQIRASARKPHGMHSRMLERLSEGNA